MFARDVMSAPVYVVSPSDNIAYARNLMVKHKISRVLVMDNGKLTGILTKKDIAYRLKQQGAAWRRRSLDQIAVSSLAVENPVVVTPGTGIRGIAWLFVEKNISCVPVVEAGTVIGIVTKADLMRSSLVGSLSGTVGAAMEDVATVTLHHSLDHVITVMSARNDKVVVTNDDGSIAGIITETNLAFFEDAAKGTKGVGRDVARQSQTRTDGTGGQISLAVNRVTAGDVMTSPVVTISPDQKITDAIALMNREQKNSLVVVENNTISGIIKRDDIIREVAK
ncbi:MAG: CBS domain-containing protein [Methanoregula sp.]